VCASKWTVAIHEAITSGAGNEFMSQLYRSLELRVLRVRYFLELPHESWARALREHEEILRLIKARKGAELAALMLAHMRGTWVDFEGAMRRGEPASV
jgi:DNA-binding GntR family transcriptional regulator